MKKKKKYSATNQELLADKKENGTANTIWSLKRSIFFLLFRLGNTAKE